MMDLDSPIDAACASPYRTAAPEPPAPPREPALHRLGFLLFLLAGPALTILGVVEAGIHLGPICMFPGIYALAANLVTPMGIFEEFGGFDDKPKSMRGKLAAAFWASAWMSWWLGHKVWSWLQLLARWVRYG